MRIFFSFSLKYDGPMVAEISNALEKFGYKSTIAISRHIHVHNWRLRLVEALRKSDGAIIIITPENEKSPYIMGELWAARLLSQINKRFVLIPVLNGTSGIPEYLSDLYVANSSGEAIRDVDTLASQIDTIFRDNRDFEVAISDLKHRVFIGHGHSDDWKKIATFVEDKLNLVVEEYDKTSPLGYSVNFRIEQMLEVSSMSIIVMSAEDEQQNEILRARQNVIHEIGLCQGRLGFGKVIVVRHKKCESFSNISGINEIQYDSENWDEVFLKIRRLAEREGLLTS